MRDPTVYIEDGIRTIRLFLSKKQYRHALIGCEELLQYDPGNPEVKKLLTEVRKKLLETNKEYIQSEIELLEPLWKEEKYIQLFRSYRALLPYGPENKQLLKLIEKASHGLRKQQQGSEKDFIQHAQQVITKCYEAGNYGDTMQAALELEQRDPANDVAEEFLRKAKAGLIEKKIQERERLVDSDDYREQIAFYQTLLAIDPDSSKLKELIADARGHIAKEDAIQHRVAINRGLVRIKKFFHEREYEHTIGAAEDVLRLDPKNFTASIYRKRAKQTLAMETDIAVQKKIQEAQIAFQEVEKKHPEAFIRL